MKFILEKRPLERASCAFLSLLSLVIVLDIREVRGDGLEPELSYYHGRRPGQFVIICDQYNEGFQFGRSVASVGDNRFVVGQPGLNISKNFGGIGGCDYENNVGAVVLYDELGQRIANIGHPSTRTSREGDQFGFTVTGVSDEYFVVGAPFRDVGANSDAGVIYVYDADGELILGVSNPEPDPSDRFGWSLAGLGRNEFLVGLGGANDEVYQYRIRNGQVSLSETLAAPEALSGFGYLLGVTSRRDPVIGARQSDDQRGAVYYYRDEGAPMKIVGSAVEPGDRFGEHAIVGYGDAGGFAVGVPWSDHTESGVVDPETFNSSGRVYLFNEEGTEERIIENPEPIAGAWFGYAIEDIGNNRLVIGAIGAPSRGAGSAGRAYMFTYDGDYLCAIENPDADSADWFGSALTRVGEERFVIGAPFEDHNQDNSGAMHLYNAPVQEALVGFEIPKPAGLNLSALPVSGPELDPPGGAFWHAESRRLYATTAGRLIVRWGQGGGDPITEQLFVVWPEDGSLYQQHIVNTPPVDLSGGGQYLTTALMSQDPGVATPADDVSGESLFQANGPGKSLLLLSTGNSPTSDPVFFQLIRSYDWNDPEVLHDDAPISVGETIGDPFEYHDEAAGGAFVYWENSYYLPQSPRYPDYYDRVAREGPIIPVNLDLTDADSDDLAVVYYEEGARLIDGLGATGASPNVYWPWKPVRFQPGWPVVADKLIIANLDSSTRLAVDPVEHVDWDIYYQNVVGQAGFNPNDEHAIRRPWGAGEAIFPLRDDLGTPETSQPYVLMTYKDGADGLIPKVKVFQVVAEEAPYFLSYGDIEEDPADDIFAGTLIQPPFPLSVLQLCEDSHGVSGPYWRDRKLGFWAKAAGDAGGTSEIVMRYFYPVQTDFFFPQPNPPAVGDHIPWLDERAGTPGIPHDVRYVIQWPDAPELAVAETLVKPKNGLPDLSSQSSAEIIYQQTEALSGNSSVKLIDPTIEHSVELLELPADIAHINEGGLEYFPTLPPQLRDRFVYDPINRRLKFHGEFVEPPAGEAYILLNVITDREKAILSGLSTASFWGAAVDELASAAGDVVEFPNPAAGFEEQGFDSLALTAGFATGVGYVTLAFGNHGALTPEADPVSLEVIQVVCPLYRGELKVVESDNPFDEKMTLRHSGDFAGRPDEYVFEWRTLPPVDGLPSEASADQWAIWNPNPVNGTGAVDITIEGAGLFTLSDNYFICRYRSTNPNNPCGTGWSEWTAPQLAEGWIKRVLSGIDPFEQRINSYRDNQVNTVVNMLSQAGPRWEGNIPLNAAAANEFGLIEIYETVLRRGTSLSIDGAPPVDYPPANDALLLAAGRLADLYMLYGNEAYADASDPTIAFGTSHGQYGSVASSIHCFMNMTDSLLGEEIRLLRGRDDSLLPPVTTAPFYNRLIWNFTGDINGGEVAYALNYNIQDENGDVAGTIDEADAKELYPQGHGDAWGHYLTAIKNYYRLLRNPNFTWVPRSEAVLVGGVPTSVDFLDERKFASAAAAKARTGAEIVNLTYLEEYEHDSTEHFRGYMDSDPERAWGLSEWGSRAGQGAYLDWVVGNAILPDEDRNPGHTGIQIVDRTTVAELREIPAAYSDIQAEVDKSDIGVSPLGLARNAVPFDISPAQFDAGRTHFEQVFDRAVVAMNNAVSVFNHANNSTQLLRGQADSVNAFQRNVIEREADFNNRLIEYFGYPYADDIGPTGTYPQGYDGPDIYHYAYVDPTELLGVTPPPVQVLSLNVEEVDVASDGSLVRTTSPIDFHISSNGFGTVKPSHWTGQRRAPGEVQLARSQLLQARTRLEQAIRDYELLLLEIQDESQLLQAVYGINANELEILTEAKSTVETLNQKIGKAKEMVNFYQTAAKVAKWVGNAAAEALPTSAGFSIDVTSVGRGAIQAASALVAEGMKREANSYSAEAQEHLEAKEIAPLATSIRLAKERHKKEARTRLEVLERLIRQETLSRLEVFTIEETVRQSQGQYLSTLSKAQRLLEDRFRFRRQTASQIQSYRYKEMAFRIFRNDALAKFRSSYDLASRYVWAAAAAYDYETNLLKGDPRGPGAEFFDQITQSRSLGLIQNGRPVTGSGQGDPGLADALARMSQNWELILKGQLGFNNPQTETGRFSLRSELFRIQPGFAGNEQWRETLERHVVPDLLSDPDFQRYCRPFFPQQSSEPGILIPFGTTINFGMNFFGWPAGGGDNSYDSSQFATKGRSAGVWFSNYNSLGGGMVNTPRVYLVPVGNDIMRSPTGLTGQIREWTILDQALPVALPLSGADLNSLNWIPAHDSLSGFLPEVRRYSSFRAYHDSGNFNPAETINDSRIVGRSVWNTKWLLIIPAGTLHSDRQEGLERFIHGAEVNGARNGFGVSDIKLFFQTYAYSGN